MDEAKGPNPYFEGLHEGESDELRNLRLALVSECKELRETLTTISDALDYLHGMTPQQAAEVRKDAGHYRWLREQIEAGRLTIAKAGGWDGLEPWSGDKPDEAIAAAMLAAPAAGAA